MLSTQLIKYGNKNKNNNDIQILGTALVLTFSSHPNVYLQSLESLLYIAAYMLHEHTTTWNNHTNKRCRKKMSSATKQRIEKSMFLFWFQMKCAELGLGTWSFHFNHILLNHDCHYSCVFSSIFVLFLLGFHLIAPCDLHRKGSNINRFAQIAISNDKFRWIRGRDSELEMKLIKWIEWNNCSFWSIHVYNHTHTSNGIKKHSTISHKYCVHVSPDINLFVGFLFITMILFLLLVHGIKYMYISHVVFVLLLCLGDDICFIFLHINYMYMVGLCLLFCGYFFFVKFWFDSVRYHLIRFLIVCLSVFFHLLFQCTAYIHTNQQNYRSGFACTCIWSYICAPIQWIHIYEAHTCKISKLHLWYRSRCQVFFRIDKIRSQKYELNNIQTNNVYSNIIGCLWLELA